MSENIDNLMRENTELKRQLQAREKMIREANQKLNMYMPDRKKPIDREGYQISLTKAYWRRIKLPKFKI